SSTSTACSRCGTATAAADLRARALHRLRRGHAEEVECARDRALRRQGQRQPERLHLGRLGPDDAAVAVEGGELLRELERVGGEAVRRPAAGGLLDLGGEGEQL